VGTSGVLVDLCAYFSTQFMDKWQCFFIQSFDFAKVANLCWENTFYTIHKNIYFKFFARAFHKTARGHWHILPSKRMFQSAKRPNDHSLCSRPCHMPQA
jgi:hypothetical protein